MMVSSFKDLSVEEASKQRVEIDRLNSDLRQLRADYLDLFDQLQSANRNEESKERQTAKPRPKPATVPVRETSTIFAHKQSCR